MKTAAAVSIVMMMAAASALAADYPANHCEIFIRKVSARPSSHGSAGFRAVVKVGWIGNGETIQRVGFYGSEQAHDLGNLPECHNTPFVPGGLKITDGAIVTGEGLEYGEYVFDFHISTGSLVSQCPGYTFTSAGAFFVQTNKNTYWLNPDMDPAQSFYFDRNGYDSVSRKGGQYSALYTDRDDLRYYNPLGCR